jgi:hypothetical protein
VVVVFKTAFHIFGKLGGKRGGPNKRKAAWDVHEPQILSFPHAGSPPRHLQ